MAHIHYEDIIHVQEHPNASKEDIQPFFLARVERNKIVSKIRESVPKNLENKGIAHNDFENNSGLLQ